MMLVMGTFMLAPSRRGSLRADEIILKNGAIMEGKIISDDGQEIVLKVDYGQVVLNHDEIASIEKSEFVPKEASGSDTIIEPSFLPVLPPDESKPDTPAGPDNPPKADGAGESVIEESKDVSLVPVEIAPITPTVIDNADSQKSTLTIKLKLSNEGKTGYQQAINNAVNKLVVRISEDLSTVQNLIEELIAAAKEDIPYMIELLNQIEEPKVLRWVIYALGETKDAGAIEFLLPKLNDKDETVQKAVVDALVKMEAPGIIGFFREQIKAGSFPPAVMVGMINALGRAKDKASIFLLLDLLDNKNNDIRYAASHSVVKLFEISGEGEYQIDVVAVLKNKLIGGSPVMKKEIVNILNQLKNPEATDLLIELLTDENEEVRSMSAIAIGNLGITDHKIIEFLGIRLLEEPNTWTRMQIIQALQKSNDYSVIPIMIEGLKDQEENIRLCAARALKTITKRSFGDNYSAWKGWWDTLQGKN